MKRILALLLLPTAALATPYTDALNHACPQKHLELLTAGDLDFGLENYLDTLPPHAALDRRMEAARNRDCAHVEMGLSCSNGAAIGAMRPPELTGFVRYLCRQPVVCDTAKPCGLPGS